MEQPQSDVSELGFDQVIERLRAAVQRLEAGSANLEDALRIYEEGVRLARRGHSLLDRAEKRVELLVREGREGAATVPLESGALAERDPDARERE